MDVVWKVEDKTKLSTIGAVAVFVFIIFLLILVTILLILAVLKSRMRMIPDPPEPEQEAVGCSPTRTMSTTTTNETSSELSMEGEITHNFPLPVLWQRPILMGEKCEFPSFSGLILYDERGMPARGPIPTEDN